MVLKMSKDIKACDEKNLKAMIQEWAQKLRVKPRVIRVQRMTRKWGSCSSAGTVSFALDLMQKPKHFQEYVVAHELLHLRVHNHGKLFKATMGVHFPRWKEIELER